MPAPVRRFKAGDTIEDLCRACKVDRLHTVVAADSNGAPLRVICDYCRSEHNYRGGAEARRAGPAASSTRRRPRDRHGPSESAEPFPLVSDRERTAPADDQRR